MTKLWHTVYWFVVALWLVFGGKLPAQVQTPADTADYKCTWANLDTLKTANGVGQKRRLSDNGKACLNRLFTRNDSIVKPPPPPPPPIANMTVACDTTYACVFNGKRSTGYKIRYAWTCGTGCASAADSFRFVYPSNGPRTATLRVTDSLSRFSDASTGFTVPEKPIVVTGDSDIVIVDDSLLKIDRPTLPLATADATPKTCATHKNVFIVDDLQFALNASVPDQCLDLDPAGKWTGNFILPKRTCAAGAAWTTITTRGVIDVPGKRMTPTVGATLAQIISNNNQPALAAGHPTCNWQIMHLNMNVSPAFTGLSYHLFQIGDGGWAGGGEFNTSLAVQPRDVIVRRNWIHGQPSSNLVRCMAVNSIRTAIVDNWIDDCHAAGFDAQGIEGWNGQGPYLIENNFVGASTENIMFGGADPAIRGLRPADITIRRNHVWKDPTWKGKWLVKNLFELKNAKRVLVEGNVFENNWADGQSGMAMVIKSSMDVCGQPGGCGWEGTTDLTVRGNIIKNSPRGFNLQAYDPSGQAATDDSTHVRRVIAEHNLFDNIGTFNGTGADGWLILLTHNLRDVAIRRNTFVGNLPGAGLTLYMAYAGNQPNGNMPKMERVRILDNATLGQGYYHIGSDNGTGCCTAALNAAIADWTFGGNVVSQVEDQFQNPSGNTYLTNVTQAGLTAQRTLPLYPNKGADMTLVYNLTNGVADSAAVASRPKPALAVARHPITKADSAFCRAQGCLQTKGIEVKPTPGPRRRR